MITNETNAASTPPYKPGGQAHKHGVSKLSPKFTSSCTLKQARAENSDDRHNSMTPNTSSPFITISTKRVPSTSAVSIVCDPVELCMGPISLERQGYSECWILHPEGDDDIDAANVSFLDIDIHTIPQPIREESEKNPQPTWKQRATADAARKYIK